ncbi:MAG: tetratricopeptide repeat protein [Spirochaetes bacterium]|nr:tetratricopeptide repeat protein [Spirochaetota bacterium]
MKGYQNYYKKKNKKLRYLLLGIVILFAGYLIIKSIKVLPFFSMKKEKYTYIENEIYKFDKEQDRIKKKVILSKINQSLNKLIKDEDNIEDGTLSYLAGSVNYRKGLLEYNKDLRNMYLDKAIYYFRMALALLKKKEHIGRLHYELGKCYFYKGEYYYYESLMELQQAQKKGYRNKNIEKIIAVIKLKKDDVPNINDLIMQFKDSKEGEVESFFYDALTYKNNKDYKKATENFLKVEDFFLKKGVETVEKRYIIFKALFNLGWLYYNDKEYTSSEEYYKKSLEYEEKNADVYYWLGKVYLAKKNKKEAKNMFQEALKYKPDHQFAKIKLKQLRRGR